MMDVETNVKASAAVDTATSAVQEQTLLTPENGTQAEGSEGQRSAAEDGSQQKSAEAEGEKPLLSPEEEKPESEGAPESYEAFKMPEGFQLEGETLTEVNTMFKGMNLSQGNAQKLVDYFTKRVTDGKAEELEELLNRRKAWRSEVRQRPDFANERSLALKGMRAVVTDPDEKELFMDSWMSDHPALWKMFTKIGRLVGEDAPPMTGGNVGEENLNVRRFAEKN